MYGHNPDPYKNHGTYVISNQTYSQDVPYQQNIAHHQAGIYQNGYVVQTGQPVYSQPIVQGQPLTNIQYTNVMGQENSNYQQNALIVVAQPAPFEIEGNDRLPSHVRSRHPREIKCPTCHRKGVTTTKHVVGGGTWTIGLALFCCGCWPCACIPCFLNDCMDVQHLCPNCGAEVGVNRYLFDD